MPRPKKRPDYDPEQVTRDFMSAVADAFGFYDDRMDDTAPGLNAVAAEFGITALKARKLLITAGVYSTALSRRIAELAAAGYKIEQMMKEQKRLKTIHMTMLAAGLIMDVIEIGLLVWWIFTGMWAPFAVGMAVVVTLGILVTRYYYHHTAYRCPHCRERFRPALKAFLFSAHTPKTRKLCCPKCGYQGFCVETASETEEK